MKVDWVFNHRLIIKAMRESYFLAAVRSLSYFPHDA